LVKAGRIHRLVREAATFGTETDNVRLDWAAVVRRQHEIVKALQPSPESLAKSGAKVVLGEGRFLDTHTLEINGQRLTGERVVIAGGSEPVIPPIEGRELAITSNDLLFLPAFPERLVLMGAGVIGLEMASAFADLGATVTVLGREAEVLPTLDPDVAAYIRGLLEARGVTFHLEATVTRVSGRRGDLTVHFTKGGSQGGVSAAQVCLAVGRRFNPSALGADAIGLELVGAGIKVSRYLQTSLPHIYAAGDAAGGQMLTPLAAYEGKLAARNALRGNTAVADYTVVPQTVFTTPEIGRVGLTHKEALRRGVKCHVSTHDMKDASNGLATGENAGFLKLVFDGESERLLGVQLVNYAAAELVQLGALAIRTGATAAQISNLLSIHPSHGERFLKVAGHDYHEVCEV